MIGGAGGLAGVGLVGLQFLEEGSVSSSRQLFPEKLRERRSQQLH